MPSADRAVLVAAVGLALVAVEARAEYPPGPLSRAHAHLEGLGSCTLCHVLREPNPARRCMACHAEIASRVAAAKGPHGHLPPSDRGCAACHPEHKGLDVSLIDWGPGGRDGFDHGRTGWPLRDKHARVRCADCHRRDRVQEEAVRKILGQHPEKQTYLGAPTDCIGCHRDVHEAQLSRACEGCHGEHTWKPADRFSHARTKYPLDGKHAQVECRACHPTEVTVPCPPHLPCGGLEPQPPRVRYRPLPYAACEDCHRNTHTVQFSERCVACHVTASWLQVDEPRFVARHAETRYPLKGAHVRAPCRSCHWFGGDKPRFTEIPFRSCSDCHADAHAGQLASDEPPARGCDSCHALDAFKPVRYGADAHERTRYPLAGAHRAVACARCHPDDPSLETRLPPPVREKLEQQGRPVRVARVKLKLQIARPERCDGCHKDPHGGQMAERIRREGCGGCHDAKSFRLLRFDHQATAFPLAGKHAETACSACHPNEPSQDGRTRRYRGVPKACDGCHDDAHAGQLALDDPRRAACEPCHDAVSWKKTRFVHAPPFTDYLLEGRHAQAKCAACHFKVAVAGREVVRYRPLPADCERCHVDEHGGKFGGYQP